MKKILTAVTVAMSVVLLTTSCSAGGTSEKFHADADYPLYASIEELAAESDGGFLVKVGDIVSRQCDGGGGSADGGGEPTYSVEDTEGDPSPDTSSTPSPEPTDVDGIEDDEGTTADTCIPMVLQKATVQGVIYEPATAEPATTRGGAPVPLAEVLVANVDTEAASMDGASALIPGTYAVLYLDDLAFDEHPGLETAEDLWVPVGGDQGILDVEGETVTARAETIKSLTTDGTASRSISSGGSDRFTTTISELKALGASK